MRRDPVGIADPGDMDVLMPCTSDSARMRSRISAAAAP
jgi:hypothetical protein